MSSDDDDGSVRVSSVAALSLKKYSNEVEHHLML